MVLLFWPVNQRAPSGPAVIHPGGLSSPDCTAPEVESTTVNAGGVAVVPVQILALQIHRLPSAPAVMQLGALSATGMSNKVTTPDISSRPHWPSKPIERRS